MTGSAPVIGIAVDQDDYWPGDTVVATPAYSDPDTRGPVPISLDGTSAPDGTAMHLEGQVTYTDLPDAVWYWESAPDQVIGRGVLPLDVVAPAASDVLVLQVTDRQGNSPEARCPVTVRTLRVGLDVQGSTTTLAQLDAAYQAWPAFSGPTKLFWSAGRGLPTWDGKTAHVPASAIPHLCFVDMPTQAQWLTFLDAVPAGRPEVWLTWLQEGDRKTTATDFRARWGQLIAWAAGHRNRARVRLVPVLTWYWQHYKGGDRYADWWPPGADLLGVDIYPGGQTNWTDPAECLRAPLAAAEALGVPIAITEANVVVPANPTLTQLHARADWWAGLLGAAVAGRVRYLAVWLADGDQVPGTGGFIPGPTDPMRAVILPYLRA